MRVKVKKMTKKKNDVIKKHPIKLTLFYVLLIVFLVPLIVFFILQQQRSMAVLEAKTQQAEDK